MKELTVFLGPTLPVEEARALLPEARFLPPARRGDVYRACLQLPWGIALVDGYFDHVLSVWHKEILWALSRGIRVYGASSMGALRAAELYPFGMVGVGTAFTLYREGRLEDDDEVAVAHRDEAEGHLTVSDAMINIRATLGRAERLEVASRETLARLLVLAKTMFYPERSLRAAIALARGQGCAHDELDRLAKFCLSLPGGIVDVKRDDAIELLIRLRRDRAAPQPAFTATFHFEHTDAWDQFLREVHTSQKEGQEHEAYPDRRT